MKNKILAAAILAILGVGRSFAVSPITEATVPTQVEPITTVIGTVSSTDTVRGISISSSTPTSVVVDTAQRYRQVCVQNLDTTAALYCAERSNVSNSTASDLVGVVIAPAATATTPATPVCFSIRGGTDFYCKTGSTSASTRAVIVRGR